MALKQKKPRQSAVKTAAKTMLTAAAVGAALRAVHGGASGEEHVEKKVEHELPSEELMDRDGEQFPATSEKKVEEELSRLVDGSNKERVEGLVAQYEAAMARLESEKASGTVSESTLNEVRTLPGRISREVGLSREKLDELKGKVSGNVKARELRRPYVVDVRDRDYSIPPSLSSRVGNILFGLKAPTTQVHEEEVTVAVPGTLPTLKQLNEVSILESEDLMLSTLASHASESAESGHLSFRGDGLGRHRRKAA